MAVQVFAFANQKGGVGKTTSCVNLACCFTMLKKRVLLIDLDPQGNATMGSGINKNDLTISMNDVMHSDVEIQDAIIPKTPGGFDLLPSNSDLTAAEVNLVRLGNQEGLLKKELSKLTQYDFVLIDCPPALNMLTLNALTASHAVIIPMQCEYYAMEGLSSLLGTLEQLKQTLNPEIHITGIIRTMFDSRNRLAQEVSDQLVEHFGENVVYKTVIPRNVRLAEAPSHGVPIMLYDKHSRGAQSYLALAQEMLVRVKVNKKKKSPIGLTEQEEALICG